MKVLLIEDDKLMANMYEKAFRLAGHEAVASDDGLAALKEMVEKMAEMPSLIVLDLMMPRMNGYDFLSTIKMNMKFKDIPVMVLSNLSRQQDVKKAMDLGAAAFLVKNEHLPNEIVKKAEELTAGHAE